MVEKLDPMAPVGMLCGLLAAAVGLQIGLVIAVLGQAIGSLLGGCAWIGISLPIHLQPWALVNQPTLDFSSRPEAVGYWLGSLLLPLMVSLGAVGMLRRPRTVAAQLLVVQIAWGAAVIALAWLPLLDAGDGHVCRWLQLAKLPQVLVWAAPLLAAGAAVFPTLRLLALVRSVRPHTGRGFRLLVVAVHLAFPCAVWAVVATLLSDAPPVAAIVGLTAPTTAAAAIAFIGYPPPYPHRLDAIDWGSSLRLAVTGAALGLFLWVGGRPLPDGGCAAVLWGKPLSYNNIRQWIRPITLPQPWLGVEVRAQPPELE